MNAKAGREPPLSILVVDGDPDETRWIRETLREQPQPVEVSATAGSLADAEDVLQEGHFDAVLLDLDLPDAPGIAAVRSMVERHPSLPVVVLTNTVAAPELARAALEAGAQDHVLKRDGTGATLCRAVQYAVARHRLDTSVRWGQRMEALGRFAAGIAHDFNNVLAIVSGYADLALGRLEEDTPLHREVSMIRDAGQRAASFTRRLLAFSRAQVLQPVAVSLSRVVRDCDEMLRHVLGDHIILIVRPALDLSPVLIDMDQLHDALLNLCINARDAMPGGGTLTIATGRKYIDEVYAAVQAGVLPGPYVVLSVSDTGCGMDKDTQARIFEPFFTTKPPEKGTGLGLPSVYGLVKQSGGHIEVYSEVGLGTTFRVYLPAVEQTIVESEEEPVFETDLEGTETVLLVEDQEAVRDVAFDILQLYGYHVLVAEHPREAIEIARRYQGRLHLLLTDVLMPEMCGPEVAEKVRGLHSETRVLYMSGYAADAIEQNKILEHGAAFLEKPFTPDEMARKVRAVLTPRTSVTR